MEYNDSPTDKDDVLPKGLRFKSDENLKIQKPNIPYQSSVNNEMTIPYGTDFTNLENRLTTLESSGSSTGLTVEDIKTNNPYLGID
jgi:hypothetical protein